MLGADGGFGIDDHAIEAFLGRLGVEFLRQGNMFLGGETKAIQDSAHLGFRFFDALADRHFTLAVQERRAAHLFEVKPDGIVQNVQPLSSASATSLVWDEGRRNGSALDDFNARVRQRIVDVDKLVRRQFLQGARFAHIIKGEVALWLAPGPPIP